MTFYMFRLQTTPPPPPPAPPPPDRPSQVFCTKESKEASKNLKAVVGGGKEGEKG